MYPSLVLPPGGQKYFITWHERKQQADERLYNACCQIITTSMRTSLIL